MKLLTHWGLQPPIGFTMKLFTVTSSRPYSTAHFQTQAAARAYARELQAEDKLLGNRNRYEIHVTSNGSRAAVARYVNYIQ